MKSTKTVEDVEKLITYKEWYKRWDTVFCERTVTGTLGALNRRGEVPIIVEGKVVARPRQADIKGYYPKKEPWYSKRGGAETKLSDKK